MSTTNVTYTPSTETAEGESSAHISVNSVIYRTYGGFDSNGKAKGAKKDKDGNVVLEGTPSVLSQTQTGKNWEAAEQSGATILCENQFKFYTLVDLAGFETLVTSPEQRLYIVQKGIDALQNAAASSYQTEFKEKSSKDDPDEFMYNGDTIDLKESINTPPKRKSLTDEEKFAKAVATLSPEKMIAMLENYKRQIAAAAAQ